MLKIIESASSAARLAAAESFIDRFPASSEIIIVAADRAAADDFVRHYAQRSRATFGLHRFSLLQLASQAARSELTEGGLAPGSTLAEQAAVARASHVGRFTGRLSYFNVIADRPGFARALRRTLSELRMAGIHDLPTDEAATKDVGVLSELYSEALENTSIVDRSALFAMASDAIVNRTARTFLGKAVLLLDVPVTCLAERNFVTALCRQAPHSLATVPSGDIRSMNALRTLSSCEPRMISMQTDSALRALQENLFSTSPAREEHRDDSVLFFSAPGEERESVEIARRILWQAEEGTAFDQIAIALRAPDLYAPLLEAALDRASIPPYFAHGVRRPDPSGRAFLVLLACASEGLSARRFAEYLSFGQVPQPEVMRMLPHQDATWAAPSDEAVRAITGVEVQTADAYVTPRPDSDDEPVLEGTLRAPWRWESLLVESAVIGSAERWHRRLAGLEAELQVRLAALTTEDPNSSYTRSIERDLRDLGHLRSFALPIIERLASFPREANWAEWLDQLVRLAPMVLRSPGRVAELLADMRPMAEVGPVTLDEVQQVLADRLAQVPAQVPNSRFGRVFVGTPEQLRGRSFEVVFVPGLAERIFPQRLREDPILLDAMRREIRSENMPIAVQNDRVAAERLRLHLAVGAPTHRLFLSYPRFEVAMARPRVPSLYALDATRSLFGRLPNLDLFERAAAEQSKAMLSWPAPHDVDAAIDDSEHDLATLWPLVRGPRAPGRGRAAYLLRLNSCLARSLRACARRSLRSWNEADGLCVGTAATRAALAAHRLAARPYSPTALQHYAACPYRFFLSSVYRLSIRKQSAPLQYLDPITKGSLFHAMQAHFVRQMLRQRMFPITRADFERANAILESSIAEVGEEFRERLMPAIERVWRDELDRLRGDLRGWVLRLAEAADDWVPFLIEYAFGLAPTAEHDPQSTVEPAVLGGGYRLRGVIDSVERNRLSGALRVTDFKSGKDHTREGMIVEGGEKLQPVLYPLALEALGFDTASVGRLFYCTADGGYSTREVPVSPQSRDIADQVLRTVDAAIQETFLPPAPRKKACLYCDFRSVCGPYEERRAGRKDQTRLVPLTQLRSLK
jgi:CRISPR/Cas system-associated exonuclease Cas4 (RecB family)